MTGRSGAGAPSGCQPSASAADASSLSGIPNAKHPGKTPAQRRVLDLIGCGEHSPYMAKATRDKLLRDGLIVELEPLRVPFIGSICMEVRQFEMPIHVHMQWCNAMSAESERAGA